MISYFNHISLGFTSFAWIESNPAQRKDGPHTRADADAQLPHKQPQTCCRLITYFVFDLGADGPPGTSASSAAAPIV